MVPPNILKKSSGRATSKSPTPQTPARPHQTAADTVVATIAPALIIGMICCLVFFLILVTCRGEFTVRLMYILGLYTFASVLVARIAIEQSRTLSMAYTGILGTATLFVVMKFVDFQGVFALAALPLTIGFLVLIGFLADRITFDCTLIEDSDDSSGVGLLQSLGVVDNPQNSPARFAQKQNSDNASVSNSTSPKNKTAKRKQRHNPGVWVLYFAILAIPLFGLGQITIPASEAGSRAAAYWFLFGYLFFSLCLLVSTSFLGLRRYLRQRNVEMPIRLNVVWIGGGVIGVFLVLLAVSLLPLPSGSLGFFDLPIRIETATKLQPNQFGWGQEGTEQDTENAAKVTKENAKAKATDESTPSNEVSSEEKAESKDGSAKMKGESKDSNKTNDSSDSKKSPSSDTNGKSKSNEPPKSQPKEPSAEDRAAQKKQDASKKESSSKSQDSQPKQEPASSSWSLSLAGGLSNLLRWIVSLLLLLVIAFLVLRYRDELALIFKDLAAWWRGLFGVQVEETKPIENTLQATAAPRVSRKSFEDYVNPFSTNGAGWNAAKIIRHTFEAIEAWGRERQLSRSDQETPEEFLRRLATKFPDQSESILRLTQLYNRLAYANTPVDANDVKRLSGLWNWLNASRVV